MSGSRTKGARAAAACAVAVAFAWASSSWFEAEKEVRILCANLGPDRPVSAALAVLETGNYLRYASVDSEAGPVIEVTSPYTLGGSMCTLGVAEGTVVSSAYRAPVRVEWIAAAVAVALLIGVAGFQLLLALSLPLGWLAWGGSRAALPPKLRVVSGVLAVALQVGAALLLERVGAVRVIGDPDLAYGGVWVLVAVFALSAVANAISRSAIEKRVMTPIAAALAASCMIVALSPVPGAS